MEERPEDLEFDAPVEEAVPVSEVAPTPADMPPDLGAPGVADFRDPAWDDDVDDSEEDALPGEPDDQADDDDEDELDPNPEPEGEPTVPPGITEDEDELEDPDEPEDYNPEE